MKEINFTLKACVTHEVKKSNLYLVYGVFRYISQLGYLSIKPRINHIVVWYINPKFKKPTFYTTQTPIVLIKPCHTKQANLSI